MGRVFPTAGMGRIMGCCIIAVAVAALAAGAFASLAGAAPRAVRGHLDLTGWNPQRAVVRLDGEWEFHWGQLVEPGAPGAGRGGEAVEPGLWPRYAPVPGVWRDLRDGSGAPLPGQGYATYRLRVTVPDSGTAVPAVAIPYAWTAYRLYVDGVPVAANGTVSPDLREVRPRYAPVAVPLPGPVAGPGPGGPDPSAGAVDGAGSGAPGGTGGGAGPRTIEFILQVANAHLRSGGLPRGIILGSWQLVDAYRSRRHMAAVALATALAGLSVYLGASYVRVRSRPALYGALLGAVGALRALVTGDMALLAGFPHIPWEVHVRLEYLTAFVGLSLFLLYLLALGPAQPARRAAVRAAPALAGVGGAAALLLPVHTVSVAVPVAVGLAGAGAACVLSALVQAHRRAGGVPRLPGLPLAGAAVFLLPAALAALHAYRPWSTGDWLPVGVLALVLSQALATARGSAPLQQADAAPADPGLPTASGFPPDPGLPACPGLPPADGRLAHGGQNGSPGPLELYQLLCRQEERVRREVAEMLHGRAQGRLQAAWAYVAKAAGLVRSHPAEAQRLMAAARDLIDRVREEDIRRASHRLHPAGDLAAGLVAALESLVESMGEAPLGHFRVDSPFEGLDEPGGPRLPDEVRTGVYRIAEEALNNVRRHAGARNVAVVLRCVPEAPGGWDGGSPVAGAGPGSPGPHVKVWLELAVSDDGIGVEPGRVAHGLGLRLIAARAAGLGGDWHFGPGPGGGAALRVVVPAVLRWD